MANIEASTGWHPSETSATGTAHYWSKEKYSRRKSACGLSAVAKQLQDESEALGRCAKCEKALASGNRSQAFTNAPKQAQRGRLVTSKAKTPAERSKAADEAVVAAGGRIYRARLAPDATAALASLAERFGMTDKDAINAALVFAEKNMK